MKTDLSIRGRESSVQQFFPSYDTKHYHSGIGFLTPEDVHCRQVEQITKEREKALKRAFEKHPNRFKGKASKPIVLPEAVWINKPLPNKSDSAIR
jgi:putative transposase